MNKSFRVFCWVDLGSSFRKSEHYPILFSSAKGFRLPRSSYELAWNVLQEVPLALHIFFFQQNSQAIFECETKVLIIVSGLMGPATSATLSTNQMQTYYTSWLGHSRFPAYLAVLLFFLWVFIGCLWYSVSLWLVVDPTLDMVLGHWSKWELKGLKPLRNRIEI